MDVLFFSLLANSFSLLYIKETLRKIKIVFCSNAVTYKVTEWLQIQFNLLNACNINEVIVNSEPVAESDNENDSEVELRTLQSIHGSLIF